MLIGKLDKLIIYVENMSAQAKFYCQVLGLEPIEGKLPINFEELHWLALNAGEFTLALHSGGKRNFGDDAPKFIFAVENLAQAKLLLLEGGLELPDIFEAAPGTYVLNVTDPEGNKFSLEQRS